MEQPTGRQYPMLIPLKTWKKVNKNAQMNSIEFSQERLILIKGRSTANHRRATLACLNCYDYFHCRECVEHLF